MNSIAMEQALTFLAPDQRPPVLFRLLHTMQKIYGTHEWEISTIHLDSDGNLLAESPDLPLTPATADDHLSWNPTPTPYTSYFSSWRKVMQRRQWLSERGATDMSIIAIDTSHLPRILSAEAIAVALGYRDTGSDNRRKRRNHRNEYLVYGGVLADDDAILSVIPADGSEETVRVVDVGSTGLPSEFLNGLTTSIEDELETDIHRYTGVWGTLKRDRLIMAMCN